MEFQTERFEDIVGELGKLVVEHWEDAMPDTKILMLEPDWDSYNLLSAANALHITTARHEGTLVGYSVYTISNSLHHKGLKLASGDTTWLSKAYRNGTAGIRMLKAAEEALKSLGAEAVTNRVRVHRDMGRVYTRLGYTPLERVYMKEL